VLELAAWNAVAGSANPALFEAFLERFPNGVYAGIARVRLAELKAGKSAPSPEELKRVAAAEEARRKADTEEAKRRADAAAEEARRRAATEDDKKPAEGIEAALKLADIDRRRIQAALTAKGFDTQGTDGSFGPRTRLMIANWQRGRSEPTTGYLTATQAALLSREGESALARIEEERKKAPPPTAPPQQGAARFDGAWKGNAGLWGVALVVSGQKGHLTLSCYNRNYSFDIAIGADGAINAFVGSNGMNPRQLSGRLPTLSISNGSGGACTGGTAQLSR
jgi:peptidoglycan hydrolase-like protein with peptidoglycan-binding domain